MIQPSLDSRLPVPLYYQLKEILCAKIDKGDWIPGQLIPTEHELINQYKVSRTTVREAIIALVNEGRLEKRQGKGTLVCQPRIEEHLGRLSGFTEEMLKRGLVPGAMVLKAQKLNKSEIPTNVQEKLLIDKDEKVYYVKRVRLANNEPIAIEETYWDLDVGIMFEYENLSNIGFYSVLEKRGIRLRDADEVISAAVANKEEASYLQISEGYPLMVVSRIAYTLSGSPIEYSINHYRSDRYLYRVHLQR